MKINNSKQLKIIIIGIVLFSILFGCKKVEIEKLENKKDSLNYVFPDRNFKPGLIKG